MNHLLLPLLIVLGFFCALMAEIGVNNPRAFKIASWALWFTASIIWAFTNG